MTSPTSLIAELETAMHSGSQERRLETLRRVTDLFLDEAERLNDDQVDLFDDVLGHMVDKIEAQALAELSRRLAPAAKAPINVVRSLAGHDDLAIAAPVLQGSPRLRDRDLIEIAETKSHKHLMAIALRPHLGEQVTDVLLNRGDRDVSLRLAENAGARFSDAGFDILLDRSSGYGPLAERMAARSDLPPHRLHQLIVQATEEVRSRLLRRVPSERAETVQAILAEISGRMEGGRAASRDYANARNLIGAMMASGTLNTATFADFVKLGRHEETVAALAALTQAPFDLVVRIFESSRHDAVLIVCKAAAIDWPTVRTGSHEAARISAGSNARSRPIRSRLRRPDADDCAAAAPVLADTTNHPPDE